jgi:hypothetical protein
MGGFSVRQFEWPNEASCVSNEDLGAVDKQLVHLLGSLSSALGFKLIPPKTREIR